MGFSGGLCGKESASNVRDPGLIPGSGRSLGEGNDSPFQCFFLEKSMDRGAWWATVNGVEKNQTWLSMLAHTVFQTFSWLLCLIWSSAISDLWCYYYDSLKPQTLVSIFLAIKYSLIRRRQWHPSPVLLPGKSHGPRSLVGYSPWGREESDTTEQLHFPFSLSCIGDEWNGNPLQCSCLENPMDQGAW